MVLPKLLGLVGVHAQHLLFEQRFLARREGEGAELGVMGRSHGVLGSLLLRAGVAEG